MQFSNIQRVKDFSDLIQHVRNNDPTITDIYFEYDITIPIVSDEGVYKYSAWELKQLAIAMKDNKYVQSLPDIRSKYHNDPFANPLNHYKYFIGLCLKRNQESQETKFREYALNNLENLILTPMVYVVNFFKDIFSKTFGLDPLHNFLVSKGPGSWKYDYKLPSISFQMSESYEVYDDYCPTIGLSEEVYKGGAFSLSLVPINYFFTNLGKLIGFVLFLLPLPFLGIAALGKSVYDYRKEVQRKNDALKKVLDLIADKRNDFRTDQEKQESKQRACARKLILTYHPLPNGRAPLVPEIWDPMLINILKEECNIDEEKAKELLYKAEEDWYERFEPIPVMKPSSYATTTAEITSEPSKELQQQATLNSNDSGPLLSSSFENLRPGSSPSSATAAVRQEDFDPDFFILNTI